LTVGSFFFGEVAVDVRKRLSRLAHEALHLVERCGAKKK
jgi:hypothetical protein